MKRIGYILIAICLAVLGSCVFVACNNEPHPELKMFNYSTEDGQITINSVKDKYKDSTEIVIPDGVTSIGSLAFSKCTEITNITIPDSVTSIGYGAFKGCKNLNSVNITDLSKWCEIAFEDDSIYGHPTNPFALILR